MAAYYREDLAYVHDVGYGDYALQSAPGILDILAHHHICDGLIVDLGCGSGISAQLFTAANYQVLGVDISEALVAIARAKVPTAEFRVASFLTTDIPTCQAVTSIGECLNYQFDNDQYDKHNDLQPLTHLFERIYTALMPGGVFIFDIAEPGQIPSGKTAQGFTEGQDWMVLVEKSEDREQSTLTRRIITLRQVGDLYRRDDEVHHLRLYQSADIAQILNQIGFQVEMTHSYGQYQLPPAHAAFIAHKILPTKHCP